MRPATCFGICVVVLAAVLVGCGGKPDVAPPAAETPSTPTPAAAPTGPPPDPITGANMSKEEATRRYKVVMELKLLALGLQDYHDPTGHLPVVNAGDPGRGMPNVPDEIRKIPFPKGYSWRVAILGTHNGTPMNASRDMVFALWQGKYPLAADTAPADVWNRPALKSVPLDTFLYKPEYVRPGDWNTPYRVLTDGGTMFESNRATSFGWAKDGTKNTIMIVAAGESVPWPKPDELVYDPAKPLPKLFGLFPEGFYAAFGNGDVRFIKNGTDEKLIRAMITRDGGEPIPELPPVVDHKALGKVAGDLEPYKPAGKAP